MTSHELAGVLLKHPDMPVATVAHDNVYMSAAHSFSHGPLQVGLLDSYAGRHVVIGDMLGWLMTRPEANFRVVEILE